MTDEQIKEFNEFIDKNEDESEDFYYYVEQKDNYFVGNGDNYGDKYTSYLKEMGIANDKIAIIEG